MRKRHFKKQDVITIYLAILDGILGRGTAISGSKGKLFIHDDSALVPTRSYPVVIIVDLVYTRGVRGGEWNHSSSAMPHHPLLCKTPAPLIILNFSLQPKMLVFVTPGIQTSGTPPPLGSVCVCDL